MAGINAGGGVLRSCRQIEGLSWVFHRATPPAFTLGRRPRGAKGAGLRFERAVAKAIPQAAHAQWFEFADTHGLGWASPDIIWRRGGTIYVLECKLTLTDEADNQLRGLYLPLMSHFFGTMALGIVVARHLKPGVDPTRVTTTLAEATKKARYDSFPVLHWLGKGKI